MPRQGSQYVINDEQYFMLTYPTTPDGWPVNDLVGVLDRLGCDYRIGRELHQDGKPHFHAMVCFNEPYNDKTARTTFKIGGRAPNIKMRRANPERGWDYVGKHAGTKDGHYIVAEKGGRPGGDAVVSERSSADIWAEIRLARTKEEFLELVGKLAPKQLICGWINVRAYAKDRYGEPSLVEEYEGAPPGMWSVPFELQEYADNWLGGGHVGR